VLNAQHIKAVPARKTEVRDAQWIADLLQHGLLKARFIPSARQRELPELRRYRTRLTQQRAREVNRLHKTLEDTHLKVGDVVWEVMGKSAPSILEALGAGETEAGKLADVAVGPVRTGKPEVEAALTGKRRDHHRFLLREQLTQMGNLEAAIHRVTEESAPGITRADPAQESDPTQRQEQRPEEAATLLAQEGGEPEASLCWEAALVLLRSIAGISQRAAHAILAEIGMDRSRFPTAAQLACWAAVCPGHHESGGKGLSGTTRKGHPWLRRLLVQAAQ
jgi:transposase